MTLADPLASSGGGARSTLIHAGSVKRYPSLQDLRRQGRVLRPSNSGFGVDVAPTQHGDASSR
jgi:hypothetical protein